MRIEKRNRRQTLQAAIIAAICTAAAAQVSATAGNAISVTYDGGDIPLRTGNVYDMKPDAVSRVLEPIQETERSGLMEIYTISTESPTEITGREESTSTDDLIYSDSIPLDAAVQDYIHKLCRTYGIDPALVFAVIEKESTFDVSAVGDRGRAKGLMQIQSRWHEERMDRLGVTDLFDPYQNVLCGIDYLDEMLDKGYGVAWALTAYNGGEKRAHEYRDAGETSEYAESVLEMAGEIR